MALNKAAIVASVKAAIDSIDVDNGEQVNNQAIEALVGTIIDEILNNAQVIVGSGSSAGSWPII